jgi:hypothetical protein
MPVKKICEVCGKAFSVPPVRAATAKTCSNECAKVVRGKSSQRRVEMTCPVCETPFEVPVSHVGRRTYCSNACREASVAYRSAKARASSGGRNGMWKGGIVAHSEGYRYEHVGRAHPYASNGYVLQHRLVMEEHLRATDPASPFLVRLGEQLYLSPAFLVHHKDEDKANNRIENLQCVTPEEHQRLHAEMRKDQPRR